jgi:hypothetical protein
MSRDGKDSEVKKRELLEATSQKNNQIAEGMSRRSYIRGFINSTIATIAGYLGIKNTPNRVVAAEGSVSKQEIIPIVSNYSVEIGRFEKVGLIDEANIDQFLQNSVKFANVYQSNRENMEERLHLPVDGKEGKFEIQFYTNRHGFAVPEELAEFDLKPYFLELEDLGRYTPDTNLSNETISSESNDCGRECECDRDQECCGMCRRTCDCDDIHYYCKCCCGGTSGCCCGEDCNDCCYMGWACDVRPDHPHCPNYCPNPTFGCG